MNSSLPPTPSHLLPLSSPPPLPPLPSSLPLVFSSLSCPSALSSSPSPSLSLPLSLSPSPCSSHFSSPFSTPFSSPSPSPSPSPFHFCLLCSTFSINFLSLPPPFPSLSLLPSFSFLLGYDRADSSNRHVTTHRNYGKVQVNSNPGI